MKIVASIKFTKNVPEDEQIRYVRCKEIIHEMNFSLTWRRRMRSERSCKKRAPKRLLNLLFGTPELKPKQREDPQIPSPPKKEPPRMEIWDISGITGSLGGQNGNSEFWDMSGITGKLGGRLVISPCEGRFGISGKGQGLIEKAIHGDRIQDPHIDSNGNSHLSCAWGCDFSPAKLNVKLGLNAHEPDYEGSAVALRRKAHDACMDKHDPVKASKILPPLRNRSLMHRGQAYPVLFKGYLFMHATYGDVKISFCTNNSALTPPTTVSASREFC
ncbi:hypothetical protein VNO77_04070 [Canavalia gladiata]|uniref:Uncharacterized protein n=1 Tax=Canavalia gladiata TaxID=3824 RepID=A0AAN9N1K1_CANGL